MKRIHALLLSLLCAGQFTLYLSAYHLPPLSDYIAIYTAGRLPLAELYDEHAERQLQAQVLGEPYQTPGGLLPFNHPPFYVPLLWLITTEDYRASQIRWAVFCALLQAGCGLVAFLLLRRAGWSPLGAALAGVSSALFYPAFISILKGQDTVIVLLGALLWMSCSLAGKDRLAGAALALTTLRPHVALMLAIPTFFSKRRVFLWFCLTASLLTAFSVVLVGVQGVVDFLHLIRLSVGGEGYGMNEPDMYNLVGFLRRASVSPGSAHVAGWLFYLLILVLLCVVHRRIGDSDLHTAGLSGIAAVLAAPHLHGHDLSLLLIPTLAVAQLRARSHDEAASAFLVVGFSTLLIVVLAAGDFRFAGVWALILLLISYLIWSGMVARTRLLNTRLDAHRH